jgi:hypothetical protein
VGGYVLALSRVLELRWATFKLQRHLFDLISEHEEVTFLFFDFS